MNTTFRTFSSEFARRWTMLYTRGTPSEMRACRRLEIESDLWEHERAALATGRGDAWIALEIFTRMARGVPADLMWHRVAIVASPSSASAPCGRWTMVGRKVALALVVVLMTFPLINGFGLMFESGNGGISICALLSVVPGVAVLAGLALTRDSPRFGGALVTVGAVAFIPVYMWLWMPVSILAVLVIGIGTQRARRVARELRCATLV